MQAGEQWLSLPGEGGHVDFAASTEGRCGAAGDARQSWAMCRRSVSSRARARPILYRGLVKSDGREPEPFALKDITRACAGGDCLGCRRTPEPVLRAHGPLCRQPGPQHGHLRRCLHRRWHRAALPGVLHPDRAFRVAFEDKGRFKPYLKDVPVFLITHEGPGLLGGRAYLRQSLPGSVSDRLEKQFYCGSALIQWPSVEVGHVLKEDGAS